MVCGCGSSSDEQVGRALARVAPVAAANDDAPAAKLPDKPRKKARRNGPIVARQPSPRDTLGEELADLEPLRAHSARKSR